MGLEGRIAPTDFSWYSFLFGRQRNWAEVNFWKPSAVHSVRAPEFSPFLFKLKAPHNAVCGFGYFARYSRLPDWLAWECFGEANGCEDFPAMRGRIGSIRERIEAQERNASDIGCVIVVNAIFFARDGWIRQPSDWPRQNLREMRYDLEEGEGARVWKECLARAASESAATERSSTGSLREDAQRFGAPQLVRPRLGQGAFRIAVTDAYRRACAVTDEHSLPALEAAHIRPYSLDGLHEVRNGLLLRADLHRLFDLGYVTVTPDARLRVSDRLREDFSNGRSYYPLNGKEVSFPTREAEQPDRDFLRWHNQSVFRG